MLITRAAAVWAVGDTAPTGQTADRIGRPPQDVAEPKLVELPESGAVYTTEPGMVTAEWAAAAPAIVIVFILLFTGLSGALGMVSVSGAAREAARTFAISADQAAAVQVAQDIAGPEARVEIRQDGALVTAVVQQAAPGVLGRLGLVLTGKHRTVLEPGVALNNISGG